MLFFYTDMLISPSADPSEPTQTPVIRVISSPHPHSRTIARVQGALADLPALTAGARAFGARCWLDTPELRAQLLSKHPVKRVRTAPVFPTMFHLSASHLATLDRIGPNRSAALRSILDEIGKAAVREGDK